MLSDSFCHALTVRQPVNFAGGTYRHLFYVADVNASGLAIDGELNADIGASCWCTISGVQRPRPRWICSTISRPAATKSCS